jgi:preprotein translocase subunit SecY
MASAAVLLLTCVQGIMRALELAPYALYSQGFVVQTTLALVAGSFMIHHCANTITAAGVGNGSTLVICMGIITGMVDCISGRAGLHLQRGTDVDVLRVTCYHIVFTL